MNTLGIDNNFSAPKLRIAHFIGSLHTGGAENQVAIMANSLASKGHNCHIIVMHDEEGYKDSLADNVHYYNIDYRTRRAPVSLLRLYTYLANNQIDILHCHMYHASSKGTWVGRLAKVPVIVTSEHGKNEWKNIYHHLIEKQLINKAVDMRIAVSEDIRSIRINDDSVPADKIIVLPNTVNTDVSVSNNLPTPKVIGSLGRLVAAKNFSTLIHAAQILINNDRDIELIIAGEGEQRAKLEDLINNLGLSGFVKMPGHQDAEEFLSTIDIFAMSSIREGIPVALLEAMAHGLPIASTSVGGIPEVVTNDVDGLLCEPSNPKALASIIARLIDSGTMRNQLGTAARNKVLSHYSLEYITDKWIELYTSLCNKSERKC
jgi:glycosyltransferase involved in cell wall biosynthesis